jgi:hypothetical protein
VCSREQHKKKERFFSLSSFFVQKRPKISERRAIFFLPQMKNAFVPQNFSRKLYNVCTSHETTPMSEEEER